MGEVVSAQAVDGALVLRAQTGDQLAISELAEQVRPLVQRYAARFLRDTARAEDLAQTALMKAFSRMGDIRSPEAFHAWLLRITRNECLNELARHKHPQITLSTLEEQGKDIEAPAGGEHDPEEALVRVQLRSLVRMVITTLPEHYRRTLTMRALEDRSYEEISEELEVPVAVARLWYCRARKRFRQSFVTAVVARRDVPSVCHAMAGDIAEMIEGTLGRSAREKVQNHLGDCHVCRQTEDELRSTAFRAPVRAWLGGLGLGLVRLPRRASTTTGHSLQALRGAGGLARIAGLTLGATAGVAAGAVPAAMIAGAVAPVRTQASVAGAAPAAARVVAGLPGQRGGATGFALSGQPASAAGAAGLGAGISSAGGGAGILGSLNGIVAEVCSLDLSNLVPVSAVHGTTVRIGRTTRRVTATVVTVTAPVEQAAQQTSSSAQAATPDGGSQPSSSGGAQPGPSSSPEPAPSAPAPPSAGTAPTAPGSAFPTSGGSPNAGSGSGSSGSGSGSGPSTGSGVTVP